MLTGLMERLPPWLAGGWRPLGLLSVHTQGSLMAAFISYLLIYLAVVF